MHRYDRLDNGKDFVLLLMVAIPGIITFNLGDKNEPWWLIGVLWLVIIAMARLAYLRNSPYKGRTDI